MKFCQKCEALLKTILQGKDVILNCPNCGSYETADARDTLLYEENNSNVSNLEIFNVFMQNVSHDASAYREMRPCEKCGLPYMSLVRIGEYEKSKYICKCGATYDYGHGVQK